MARAIWTGVITFGLFRTSRSKMSRDELIDALARAGRRRRRSSKSAA
ncbi:hypothetical protein ABZS81_23330 [Streptomyces sp. NPDC005318]